VACRSATPPLTIHPSKDALVSCDVLIVLKVSKNLNNVFEALFSAAFANNFFYYILAVDRRLLMVRVTIFSPPPTFTNFSKHAEQEIFKK
jgi:choline-glycine betaine transporter